MSNLRDLAAENSRASHRMTDVNLRAEAGMAKITDPVQPASTFPLTALPTELQLRILRACLVADASLVNFGAPDLQSSRPRIKGRQGQDQIKPSILLTCRLYHAEGVKVFWQENTFTYVRKESPTDLWKLPVYSMLKHLSFRQLEVKSFLCVVGAIQAAMVFAWKLPVLETLNLDIALVSSCRCELEKYPPNMPISGFGLAIKIGQSWVRKGLKGCSDTTRLLGVHPDGLTLLTLGLLEYIFAVPDETGYDLEASQQVARIVAKSHSSYVHVQESIDFCSNNTATFKLAIERCPEVSYPALDLDRLKTVCLQDYKAGQAYMTQYLV